MRPEVLADRVFFRRCGRRDGWRWAELPVSTEVSHRVAVDTAGGALFCTCPFRPRPCVHAQAFALLVERTATDVFACESDPPDWLPTRLPKPGRMPQKALKDALDLALLSRMQRGLEELEVWLTDTLRRGIAATVAEDPRFYHTISKRLADASLRGLSRRIRLAGEAFGEDPTRPEPLVAAFADAAMAAQAFRRREHLSEGQWNDLAAFLGLVQKKDTVRAAGERLDDIWAVVGRREEEVDASLRERRTWLLGTQSGRFALFLDYAAASDTFSPGFAPGTLLNGQIAYYPSAWPLRALPVGTLAGLPDRSMKKWPGEEALSIVARTFAQALAHNPWLTALPAVLLAVRPVYTARGFGLVDGKGHEVPLHGSDEENWALLAAAEGHAVAVFGEWDGEGFRAFSAIHQERFIHLPDICKPWLLEEAPLG